MKLKLFYLSLMLALLMSFVCCSDNEEKEVVKNEVLATPDSVFVIFLEHMVPVKLNDKSEIPSWLIEKTPPEVITNFIKEPLYCIFRFKWKEMIWYHIQNPINSCIMCDIYDECGNQIVFETQDNIIDLLDNSKEWTCIYILNNLEE